MSSFPTTKPELSSTIYENTTLLKNIHPNLENAQNAEIDAIINKLGVNDSADPETIDGRVALLETSVTDISTELDGKVNSSMLTDTLGEDNTTVPTSVAVRDALSTSFFTWKGYWSYPVAFIANDMVGNDGEVFVCVDPHTSGATTEPGVGANWEDYWDRYSAKGEDVNITTKAKAYLNSAQDNLAEGPVKVLLNAEIYDIGGDFDTTNKRFVAPVSGYYMIIGQVAWANLVADKKYGAKIYVDGACVAQGWDANGGKTTTTRINVATVEYVALGQYIELYADHSSDATTEDLATGSNETFLCVHLLST